VSEPPAPEAAEQGPGTDEYLERVLAEIDDEVRRNRHRVPVSEERELDAMFLRHAPMGSRFGDIEAALRLVDTSAFIDPVVPVGSQLPVGTAIKKGLRTLTMWYVGYVAHQASQFNSAVSRVLHLVDNRLEQIQRTLPPKFEVPVVDPGEPGAWWEPTVLGAFGAVRGRVLHAACADGWLVRALGARGVDAYGIDPRAGVTAAAELDGTDLREEPLLDHLRAVGSGSLAGVVLTGVTEGLGVSERDELLRLLTQRLRSGTAGTGSVVVIHSLTPAAWFAEDAPVEADLAPGRPVRAATWAKLFEGWDVHVHPGASGRDYLVVATR